MKVAGLYHYDYDSTFTRLFAVGDDVTDERWQSDCAAAIEVAARQLLRERGKPGERQNISWWNVIERAADVLAGVGYACYEPITVALRTEIHGEMGRADFDEEVPLLPVELCQRLRQHDKDYVAELEAKCPD